MTLIFQGGSVMAPSLPSLIGEASEEPPTAGAGKYGTLGRFVERSHPRLAGEPVERLALEPGRLVPRQAEPAARLLDAGRLVATEAEADLDQSPLALGQILDHGPDRGGREPGRDQFVRVGPVVGEVETDRRPVLVAAGTVE